jgi:2-aminoadipate transaminase
MLAALNDYFPPEVTWTRPQGGLFLWVTMPTGVDGMRLFDEAIRHNVAFVPGQPFFAEGDVGSHMRLNFSNATPEMIREGIRRLSIAVAHEVEHAAPVESAATV